MSSSGWQQMISRQDPSQVAQIGVTVALFNTLMTDSKGYNLALLLFGLVAIEMTGSVKLFKVFTSILLNSFLLDLLTFPLSSLFPALFTSVLIGLKITLYFSSVETLRARGEEVKWGSGMGMAGMDPRRVWRNAGEGGNVNVNGGGNAGGGNTLFQMPGSFSNPLPTTSPSAPPPRFPSSGGNVLGTTTTIDEGDVERGQGAGYGHVPPGGAPGRGGYSVLP